MKYYISNIYHWTKKILLVLFVITFCQFSLIAQDAIPATGSDATGSGGSASYTVGQVVYTTYISTNGSEAQGVQQAYEISVHTETDNPIGLNLICTAYPNPVIDHLSINIESFKQEVLSYALCDLNGKIMDSNRITNNNTSIPMGHLAPSTYYLKILNKNLVVKVFIIIKK